MTLPAIKLRPRKEGQPQRPAILLSEKSHNGESCWDWQGTVGNRGYGQIWSAELGRMRSAHGMMYERYVGPVPPGLQLDHLCRNRRCCNPAHLEPVTTAENNRRGSLAKLTAADVESIREAAAGGELQKSIAARFHISSGHIGRIVRGVKWKPVTRVDVSLPPRPKQSEATR